VKKPLGKWPVAIPNRAETTAKGAVNFPVGRLGLASQDSSRAALKSKAERGSAARLGRRHFRRACLHGTRSGAAFSLDILWVLKKVLRRYFNV